MIEAVGTSLISVGTFGITSAAVYSFYGYVFPLLSIAYLTGGIIGGYLGTYAATKLAKGLLKKIFAIIIIIVAIYIIFQNLTGIL
jgi:Sulfite exporter TauE/SafE.